MTKQDKLKYLKEDMKRAERKIQEAKDIMVSNGFKMEDIRSYNAEISVLSSLKRQYEIESRVNKPLQFMESVYIPNNIYL